jgi:hypothetical protein
MERQLLAQILGKAPGLKASKAHYEVSEDHRLSVFLGEPGQAMVLRDVASCELLDHCIALVSREDGAITYLTYDAVHGLSVRPPAALADQRRAGFA